jgi:PAS domain S-box-containing protein
MTNRENLLERSPVPMAELQGPSHIMRYVNPAFCRLHGKSKAALTGKPFVETMEDKNRCLALLDRVYLTGEPETHTETGHSEVGSPYWSYAMWPVLDDAQAPVSVMMLVTETTGFHQQAGERNEELLLSSERQHEMIKAAEKLSNQLGLQIVGHKRTEEALRLSEEHFRQSIKNAPIPVIMQAEDGEVIEVSKTWTELTGYAREEMKTVNWLSRAFGQGADAVREHVRGLFAGESSIEPTEFEIETQGGEWRCWVFSAWPVGTLFDGRRYIVGTALDVTDRKRAEGATARLAAIVEFSDDAIISKDINGVITTWNKGAERLFGYTRQEAIGQSVTMLIPPDHINEEPDILARIRRGESVQHYETVRQRKDETLLDISLTVSPIFDRQGRIVGASKVARDITERLQAEEALRESEENYRTLFKAMDEGFCVIEVLFNENNKPVDYRFLEVNPAFERQTGIENAPGKRIREIVPRHEEYWFETYGEVALTGVPRRFQNRAKHLHRFYDVYAFRVGEAIERKVAVLFSDITERERTEEALRESEQRFARFMQRLPGLAWIKDIQGRYVYANDAAFKWFRDSGEKLYGKTDDELFPLETAAQFKENDYRALASESGLQAIETLQGEGGVVHYSLVSKFPIPGPDGKMALVGGMAIDVTERIQAEEALRESEERYRLLVEGAPDYAMFLIDPANVIIYWSSGAERVFGWSAKEAVGQNGNLIFTPEDRVCKQEEKELAIAMRDGHAPDRRWHLRKNGTRIWIDGVMRRLDDEDGHLRGFAKIARNATKQHRAEEELRKSHDHLERRVRARTVDLTKINRRLQAEMKERAQLEHEILLISEREKRRVGQELHDGLCQELAAAAFFLKASAQKVARKNPAQAEELIEAAKIVNDNVGFARDLARGLHPIELTASGLSSALQELAFRSSLNGITCRFNYPKPVRTRDETIALNLYRIAQEAVANALKHGKPSEIVIALSREKKGIVLAVKDNGRGLAKKRNPRGMGVHIMKYRAQTIGATFTIEPRRQGGTIVRCVLPPG